MERKHSPLSKFFDVVDKLEDILCGGTLVCLLLVVLLQVGGPSGRRDADLDGGDNPLLLPLDDVPGGGRPASTGRSPPVW